MEYADTNDELTREEEERLKTTWRKFCRESTRAQVIETIKDNREIGNTIYEVCWQNIQSRDAEDARRNTKIEEVELWAKMPLREIRRLGKKRHKSGKFLAEVIRLHETIKNRR